VGIPVPRSRSALRASPCLVRRSPKSRLRDTARSRGDRVSRHLDDVLAALGAHDHLLVRLDAALETLRQRIIAREPPAWVGLEDLLDETPKLQVELIRLDGVHTVVDSKDLNLTQIVAQIRSARPDMLA